MRCKSTGELFRSLFRVNFNKNFLILKGISNHTLYVTEGLEVASCWELPWHIILATDGKTHILIYQKLQSTVKFNPHYIYLATFWWRRKTEHQVLGFSFLTRGGRGLFPKFTFIVLYTLSKRLYKVGNMYVL